MSLAGMRRKCVAPVRLSRRAICVSLTQMALVRGAGAGALQAQTCTTQARMQPAVRSALADAALAIGSAIKAGDAPAVKASTTQELAGNFGGTEALVHSTAEKLGGETLRVTQVYELDASARKAGDTSNADFSCTLQGSSSETDFSIAGLPSGDFGFAMVEAAGGSHPWLLSLLLEREGSAWKMAGLYPRARSAAGHDGLWYWTAAREQAAAKQPVVAWLYYNEAEALLQPAPFADTTNLDKLRSEQRLAAPAEFANGLSAESPYPLKGANGTEFRVTALGTEVANDDKTLHLVAHMAATGSDNEAIRARSEAAARALVTANPGLRQAYSSVYVFADVPHGNPQVVSLPMSQLR